MNQQEQEELLKGGIPCSGLKNSDPDDLKGCQLTAKFFDTNGNPWCSQECMVADAVKTIAQSEINRLVQQLVDLRGALEPFAAFAECLPPVVEGDPRITDAEGVALNCYYLMENYSITFGHLRAAKGLLEGLKKEDVERWVKFAEEKMALTPEDRIRTLAEAARAVEDSMASEIASTVDADIVREIQKKLKSTYPSQGSPSTKTSRRQK
jgi:hypothetical protein